MVDLSPAAQAVLDVFHQELPPDFKPGGLTAALRALADQVVPLSTNLRQNKIRAEILDIAAELESTS